MSELKLPRLLAAAKEFNIGQDTLVDFLIGKGFPKDDLKPTAKLTEEMYRVAQAEFQGDKAAKMRSDKLELPKGSVAEARKKKEESEIQFDKEQTSPKEETINSDKTRPEIEGPKVEKKIDLSSIDFSTRPKRNPIKDEELSDKEQGSETEQQE